MKNQSDVIITRCVCFSSVKFTKALLLHFKISQISSLFHSVLVYFFLVFKEVGFTLSSFRRCLVIDIIPTAIMLLNVM